MFTQLAVLQGDDQDRNLKIFLYKIIKRHQLGLQFLMLLWKKPWLYFKIKLLKRCDMLRNTYNFSSSNDFGFNSFSCGPKGFHTQTSLESRARFRTWHLRRTRQWFKWPVALLLLTQAERTNFRAKQTNRS